MNHLNFNNHLSFNNHLNFKDHLKFIKNYQHNKNLLYSTYSSNPKPPNNNNILICAIFVGIYYIYKKL
jgi:hypothetical protein